MTKLFDIMHDLAKEFWQHTVALRFDIDDKSKVTLWLDPNNYGLTVFLPFSNEFLADATESTRNFLRAELHTVIALAYKERNATNPYA